MGTIVDVVQTKTKLDDSRCSTTPCLGEVGCINMINKVYLIGTPCRSSTPAGTATNLLCNLENQGTNLAHQVLICVGHS